MFDVPDAPWIGYGKGDMPGDSEYCHICDECGEEIDDFYEVGCTVLCEKCYQEKYGEDEADA